jgi:hypothetical protein
VGVDGWMAPVADDPEHDVRSALHGGDDSELDARADFFTVGDAEKIVYCASPRVTDARKRLSSRFQDG